ncbi:uncharacterized protein B0H64DRAFT_477075 [Chaetomium fimeti]|uniref:Protein kinase domain-containing protein n=1 Tax=Chaetomium fimeti TaxID=1854472 RepID=A0AAE0HBK9_9PEZI|nr:hypothetical protein B0H64DRAFT_477075 [Chaetomium fimeti]
MSSAAVRRLDITRYLEQLLSVWSSSVPYFEEIYRALPFGSRIMVDNLPTDLSKAKVRFLSNSGWEDTLAPLEHLSGLWELPSESWPTAVPIGGLRHVRHLNGNVSVIRLPREHGRVHFIFKTNLSDPDTIYHELRLLLTMPPHQHVIGKPRYIVTTSRDVDLESPPPVRVLGFILEYYESGTMAAALERAPDLPLQTKLRWATQVVRAMSDVRDGPAGFYSDLNPDNLLISPDGLDVMLIDFEQGGNWDTFLAPEVCYAGNQDGEVDRNAAPSTPAQRFRGVWQSLSRERQEKAMVFAIGKLLWCMFEGVSHTRNSTDERYETETPIEFPNFAGTPHGLRGLIRQCTAGAPEWRAVGTAAVGIIRTRMEFVVARDERAELGDGCTPREAMDAAKTLWTRRVGEMQEYMEARCRWLADMPVAGDDLLLGFPSRPSLSQVLESLTRVVN